MVSLQTPFGQFLKLPLLVEHFKKHQKLENISLMHFLEDHYTTEHQDSDQPEDEQLPFKNQMLYSIGYAILTPVALSNTVALLPDKIKIVFPDKDIPQEQAGSIFHPPRV